MPVVLAVREIKVGVQTHEWDQYGKLCISLGDRAKSTKPEHCECPFVTKWGGVDQKQSLAVFEAPTQSQLYDSFIRVDFLTSPREQGPFDRLFGRCEFYLGDLKIKQPFETLHLTCAVFDPQERRTNVRLCPPMILKCRWSWKKGKTKTVVPPHLSPMPASTRSGAQKSEARITRARTAPIEMLNEVDVTPKDPHTPPCSVSCAPCADELSPAKKEKEKEAKEVVFPPENERAVLTSPSPRPAKEEKEKGAKKEVVFTPKSENKNSITQAAPLRRPGQRSRRPTFIAPEKELKDTLGLLLKGAELMRAFSQTRL